MDYTELLGSVDVHKAQFIEEFEGLALRLSTWK